MIKRGPKIRKQRLPREIAAAILSNVASATRAIGADPNADRTRLHASRGLPDNPKASGSKRTRARNTSTGLTGRVRYAFNGYRTRCHIYSAPTGRESSLMPDSPPIGGKRAQRLATNEKVPFRLRLCWFLLRLFRRRAVETPHRPILVDREGVVYTPDRKIVLRGKEK
jgi:hypothetical protein